MSDVAYNNPDMMKVTRPGNMAVLDEQVSLLTEQLHQLRDRISPILSNGNDPQPSRPGDIPMEAPDSPLGDQINRLKLLNHFVREMHQDVRL